MSITPLESPPAPQPASFKSRRGWLIAFGILEILIGALALLLATLVIVVPFILPNSPAMQKQPPGGLVMAGAVYIVIAVFFFLAGIGSIQRRNWARLMMLIASGFWLAMGVVGGVVALLIVPKVMETQQNIPPAVRHAVMIIMISMVAVLGVLLPLLFLIFYSRKNVKATCLAREKDLAPAAPAGLPSTAVPFSASLPAPLIILVAFECLGALAVFSGFLAPATAVFVWIIRGWRLVALMFALSALSAVAAWFIYHRNRIGWQIAFWKSLFGGASTVVSLITGTTDKVLAMTMGRPEQKQFMQLFPRFPIFVAVGSAVVVAAYLIFLIYCRKFFPRPDASA